MPAAARAQNFAARAVGAVSELHQNFRYWGRAFGSTYLFIWRAALSSRPGDQFSSHFGGRVSGPLGGPKKLIQAQYRKDAIRQVA